MIIQYASDLHLEFQLNRRFVFNNGIKPEGDCLILAGDIANLFKLDYYSDFWDWCSENYDLTVMVPGNHDYYGCWGSREELTKAFKREIRPNVFCCNNTVVRLSNVDIICSTLWSEIKPEYAFAVAKGLLDFRAISIGNSSMTVDDYQRIHQECLRFIQKAVTSSSAEQIVVVTHHLPSYAVLGEVFKDSALNSGFVTELGNWIADSPINFWIYGHSHVSIEQIIGNTRLLSNQLGYVGYGEGEDFDAEKCINV